MIKIIKKHKLIFLIFILAILLRILFLDTSYFFWDETIYIMNSEFISTGNAPYVQLYERPLLLSLLVIPFIKSEIMLRLFMIILNSLAVFAIYFLASNFGRKTGIISAFLLAIFPFHIMASRWVMTDSLSFLFITLTISFYVKGIKNKKLGSYVLGGIFLSLSILLKFTNIILLPLLIILFFFFKSSFRKTIYSLFVAFMLFLPYLIFNHVYFGNLFHPIIQATHVVFENLPISPWIILTQIGLFFGFLFLLTFLGIKKKKLNLFFISWFIFTLSYFILLSQKGICKPEGIEWEIQRFLFPSLAPSLILCSNFLSKLSKKKLYVSLILIVLAFIPAYSIAYTPMIEFENGLREVSKEIGLFIDTNIERDAGIYATNNYPVIAYYSKRKTNNKLEEIDKEKIYAVDIGKEHVQKMNETYNIKKGVYIARITPLP